MKTLDELTAHRPLTLFDILKLPCIKLDYLMDRSPHGPERFHHSKTLLPSTKTYDVPV